MWTTVRSWKTSQWRTCKCVCWCGGEGRYCLGRNCVPLNGVCGKEGMNLTEGQNSWVGTARTQLWNITCKHLYYSALGSWTGIGYTFFDFVKLVTETILWTDIPLPSSERYRLMLSPDYDGFYFGSVPHCRLITMSHTSLLWAAACPKGRRAKIVCFCFISGRTRKFSCSFCPWVLSCVSSGLHVLPQLVSEPQLSGSAISLRGKGGPSP